MWLPQVTQVLKGPSILLQLVENISAQVEITLNIRAGTGQNLDKIHRYFGVDGG
jgi:hypothetical protein